MLVRGKMAAVAGLHDCRTREPRKKFHVEELRGCARWDSFAMHVQLFAANQCDIKFNKFNAVSGVLAEGVGYQCMLEVPFLQVFLHFRSEPGTAREFGGQRLRFEDRGRGLRTMLSHFERYLRAFDPEMARRFDSFTKSAIDDRALAEHIDPLIQTFEETGGIS